MNGRSSGGKDELSSTLRTLREAAGLSTRQAAGLTGFSQAKVSRLERGLNVPTEDDAAAFANAYQAAPAVRKRLLELARDIRAEHRPVVMVRSKDRPGQFQERLARIEAASALVREFSPSAVPGVLQSESYMRALMAERRLPAERLEQFVNGRLRRQKMLSESGRQYILVTTEGAFGWRLGSREEMAEQADLVATLSQLDGVRVGIIPWGAQARRVVLHGFDIYDERAVCYGTAEATAMLTEPRDITRYADLFKVVEEIAVWDDDARAVLSRIADRYRS